MMRMTKYSDYGRLFKTEEINGHEYDYYIDDETDEVMIMEDGRPTLDDPVHIDKLIQDVASNIKKQMEKK